MKRSSQVTLTGAALALGAGALAAQQSAAPPTTSAPAMMTPVAAGWSAEPLFTVSETIRGYQPVGILDGIGAFPAPGNKVDVLVNHELNDTNGYAYSLANGTLLTGARVSKFRLKRQVAGPNTIVRIQSAGLAFDTIYDRQGNVVTDPAQVNEDGDGISGFDRFCSSTDVQAGTYGFVDAIYFTGEESGTPFHPHGGTEWALDVANETIWALPALGRMAWENVTAIDSGDPGKVALVCGDDTAGAPLYLYVGEKDALGDGSFLDRNGLAVGRLYAWKADNGDTTPEHFNGFESSRTGTFVEVTVLDPAMAGQPGYDAFGYANIETLQAEADALGCFSFSRPEDLSTNPLDGTQFAFASTGRGQLYPSDNWGTVYVGDIDVPALTGTLLIVHDADALPIPDAGIRSPDNLDWADDGKIYVNEDKSTSPGSLFGAVSGVEASLWQLDPVTREITRVAVIDRSVVFPTDATDSGAGEIGNWESSGVLDVTNLFDTRPGERLLILDVQAHGLRDGSIGDNPLLDEGGQLLFLSKQGQ